ncbi:caspase family protein [Desulfobacterales bacterium HSG16]|nr:caspase family protein [Desulfobacterales bacterium HSG16]
MKKNTWINLFIMIFILTPFMASAASERGIVKIRSQLDGSTLQKQYSSGVNHALVIGIDKYKSHPNLKTAVNDAEAVCELLEKMYFFRKENIVPLKNRQATKSRIMKELRDLVKRRVKKGDNVFIYYAGHGWFDETFDIGYWVTSEATKDPVTFLENNAIYRSIAALDKKGIQHVFLVSDSCFSGSFNKEHRAVKTDIDDRYFREKYGKPSRNILTSGGMEPVADGGKEGHSIFAYYFLKTLKENRFPYLSGKQLGVAVEAMVTRNSNQTPISKFIHGVGDEDGQFFFINKKSKPGNEAEPVEPNTFSLPGEIDVSFDDIIKNAEIRRKAEEKWGIWQESMGKKFLQVQKIDSDRHVKPKQKEVAWKRFLAAVASDNQFSEKDDEMRSYSKSRISHWEKIKLKKKRKPKPVSVSYSGAKSKEIDRDGRFIAYENGTVLDTETRLMWAAEDNGKDINWKNAKRYCENYQGGGYTDWRLPTINELRGLYDENKGYGISCYGSYKIHLTKLISLTCCCPWSSETSGSSAAFFYFRYGGELQNAQSYSGTYRVLPVRAGN